MTWCLTLEQLVFCTKPLQTSPCQGRLTGFPPDKGGLRGVGFSGFAALTPEQLCVGNGGPELFLLQLPLRTDEQLAFQLSAACSKDRQERADRYRLLDDRIRCLAAGWLLRHAVRATTGIDPVEGSTATGQPLLRNLPALQVSLAHSSCWVACTLHSSQVGVDIELFHEPEPGVPELVMAPSELADYLALTDSTERQHRFCSIWTLKEAWLKAIGTGLDRSPASFAVDQLCRSSSEQWRSTSNLLPDGSGMMSLFWRPV